MKIKVLVPIIILSLAISLLFISIGIISQDDIRNSKTATYNFLYHKMDQFAAGQENRIRLIASYTGEDGTTEDSAFTYDNSLAIMAFLARGTEEDIRRAGILVNTLIVLQMPDGRLKRAYSARNIANYNPFNGSDGGLGWTIIAWLQYYNKIIDPREKATVLDASIKLAEFIHNNFEDSNSVGYFFGFGDWSPNVATYKSTENNICIYTAFMLLFEITGDIRWKNRAFYARRYVEQSWDGEKFLCSANNTDNIILDVNPLSILVLGNVYKYSACLDWAKNNLGNTADGFNGFAFGVTISDPTPDGVWFEGTAQMTAAYKLASTYYDHFGNISMADSFEEESETYLRELMRSQFLSTNDVIRHGGIFAASRDNLSTGFGWSYPHSLHIGSTCWFLFDLCGYNPLWGIPTRQIPPYQAPYFNISDEIINEGEPLLFTLSVVDPDSDTFIYSASGLPRGANFNINTGEFSWTPAYEQAGAYRVTFSVSDGELIDTKTITIIVNNINRPPILLPIGNITVITGSTISFRVSATDPDRDRLSYSATNLPSGATFNNRSRKFTWIPKRNQGGMTPNAPDRTYYVTFTVTDNGAPVLEDSETISIYVSSRRRTR